MWVDGWTDWIDSVTPVGSGQPSARRREEQEPKRANEKANGRGGTGCTELDSMKGKL